MLIFHVGCVWILSIVFGLYNCGIWLKGSSITYMPPYAKKLCQKDLCRLLLDYANCNWIVQLYLDCTIVIGLYDCIWIVLLYLDYIIAGHVLPIPPPPSVCAKKSSKKIIVSIVVGICRLNLDYVNCIWIVLIVFGLCDFIWIV